ncbi:hypothetical protein P8C59_005344 [Phyllachora maydis]|uniref:Uncharacterized protein n=1 Tax=Phyllachora maydis TaxID=1825666 RepID=A0AAD9I5X6_9PEZI|nr:hypothetical protein P8C59_005344 [Phyllachora maydis]
MPRHPDEFLVRLRDAYIRSGRSRSEKNDRHIHIFTSITCSLRDTISIEIGPSKLELYESSSNSESDEPLLDKPINPVIVESTRPIISIRKPELPEPITNEPLNNSDLISKGDKIQLDYYKLLAKTSSYILSFVYKA